MSSKVFCLVRDLVVVMSLMAFVECQNGETATPQTDIDTQKKVGIVYLIPFFQTVPEEKTENEENLNEIDSGERRILPLPRLLLILAPARNEVVPDQKIVTTEVDVVEKPKEPVPQERRKRSLNGFGGGCTTCGYNPGGIGIGQGGIGQGNGGGRSGSWSTSSSSASSGGYGGGGGGSGGQYGPGRK